MSADFVYFRPAKVKDSSKISRIEHQFFRKYPNYFNAPSPSKKYRKEIGNLVEKNPLYLVAEKRGDVIASIRIQFNDRTRTGILGYPIGDINEPGLFEFQKNLIDLAILHAKERGMSSLIVYISKNHPSIQALFKTHKFRKKKVTVELWEAKLNAGIHELPKGYTIRPIKQSDLNPSWEWIRQQFDSDSPLAIPYITYKHIFENPAENRDGWAVVEKEGIPYAIVTSFLSTSNSAVIFGPFCKKRYQKLRIPLLNELLWHYSLLGVDTVRILRNRSFMNDKKLFQEFNFKMVDAQFLFKYNL